ncbi:hypothetical protein HY633_00815 [Candidatus Uhrbacteria bacterium]|nr:hypothetical protein [Candidatus Uhrbacteria bacterium]
MISRAYNKSTVATAVRAMAVFLFSVALLVGGQSASAATKIVPKPVVKKAAAVPVKSYVAKELIRSEQKLEMAPGETVKFIIGFKNTGKSAWKRDGKQFLSVYTYGPKYRKSVFYDTSWMNERQPARLEDAEVKPGQIGRFSFNLYAPLEPGKYKETFIIAAEDAAWVDGSQFVVEIAVKDGLVPRDGKQIAPGYKAMKLLVSEDDLSLDGGDIHEFKVAFKNIGRVAWKKSGVVLRAASDVARINFRHDSWKGDVVTSLLDGEVKPGGVAFFTFSFKAPSTGGKFTPRFELASSDLMVDGGVLEFPVAVTQDEPPPSSAPHLASEFAGSGNRGPNIRVGICYIPPQWDRPTTSVAPWNQPPRDDLPSCNKSGNAIDDMTLPIVLAAPGTYTLRSGDGSSVRSLSGVTAVHFDFASKMTTVRNGDFAFTSSQHVVFVPDQPGNVLEIQNMDNRPAWDTSINFNKYRGSIEVRYTPISNRLWIIEELPMEDYVRGLAETSNASPSEFQKALVTAFRTYALYVVSVGGKHQSEFHHVNRTGNDQVYKGYASELVRPNVVRAAEETRGIAATWNGEIAVTPYFSRSEGRTRSWSEVWYGSRPWLITKPAPYDLGKTMWGHGVGMSASDAVGRANSGFGWREILQYYYTGIDLRQVY